MSGEEHELQSNDTLKTFKDHDGNYYRGDRYQKSISVFRLKIKEIITLYEKLSERGGDELLVLLNKSFGYLSFGDIQWGETEKIKTWVKNNWFRFFQILSPNDHAVLMQSGNEYSTWFREMEIKHKPRDSFHDKYQ